MLRNDRCKTPIRYAGDMVISTAQNREDVLLNRVLGEGIVDGFYVDVGAGDPNWDSVTNWFYRKGWSGINVEANPMFAPIYAVHRPRDVNLSMGVGLEQGHMTFHEVLPSPGQNGWGLSSFDSTVIERARALGLKCRAVSVEVSRLDTILSRHAGKRTIHFLKIDVEGFEGSVIRSIDWQIYRPIVVCVEAVRPNSAIPSFHEWEDVILDAGYVDALFDGVNKFYLDEKHLEMLSQFDAGVNVNDKYRAADISDFDIP